MTRCQWATCSDAAVQQIGEWLVCAFHRELHLEMLQGETDDLKQEIEDAEHAVRVLLIKVARSRAEGLDVTEAQDRARLALEHVTQAREALAEHYQGRGMKVRPPLFGCGSHAAYTRHRAKGEIPGVVCEEAERLYQSDLHLQRKSINA